VDNGVFNCQKFVFVPFSVDSIKRELWCVWDPEHSSKLQLYV
jgi:hypothetical protein